MRAVAKPLATRGQGSQREELWEDANGRLIWMKPSGGLLRTCRNCREPFQGTTKADYCSRDCRREGMARTYGW